MTLKVHFLRPGQRTVSVLGNVLIHNVFYQVQCQNSIPLPKQTCWLIKPCMMSLTIFPGVIMEGRAHETHISEPSLVHDDSVLYLGFCNMLLIRSIAAVTS